MKLGFWLSFRSGINADDWFASLFGSDLENVTEEPVTVMAQGRGSFNDTNKATTEAPQATSEAATTTEDPLADLEVIYEREVYLRRHCMRWI